MAWGYNYYGQTSVPWSLTNAVGLAGGAYHSLALQADGTVVAWGYNNYGQVTVPVGLTNVVAVAAGASHSLALAELVPLEFQIVLDFWSVTKDLLQVRVTGVPAFYTVVLEASTNLTEWSCIASNISMGLPLEFTQPTTAFRQLFLRARAAR